MPRRPIAAFILSCTRSGSTWLNLVIGSHSWAASVSEYRRSFTGANQGTCLLCEADDLPECTVLHGVEKVAKEDAFHFAAERFGRDVIIDSSKRLDWCSLFLGNPDLDVRLIHLVRHPCGYVASRRQRLPDQSPEKLLGDWELSNREIADFATASGAPTFFACYDHLIDHPDRNFPPLCAFLDHTWEPPALQYWTVPHHGMAGNGASSLYLGGRKVKRYTTPDEAFYAALAERPPAADRRWKSRLPPEFCNLALAGPFAVEAQRKLGEWESLEET